MTPYNLQLQKKKNMLAKTQVIVIPAMEEKEQDFDMDVDMDYELKEVTTVDEFISVLFAARNTIHLHHLKVNGLGAYAKHIILDSVYKDLIDLIDQLAESVQAERLLELEIPCSKVCCEPLDYISDLLQWVRDYRSLFKYSFQQGNILDPIEELLSSAKYKLTNLG